MATRQQAANACPDQTSDFTQISGHNDDLCQPEQASPTFSEDDFDSRYDWNPTPEWLELLEPFTGVSFDPSSNQNPDSSSCHVDNAPELAQANGRLVERQNTINRTTSSDGGRVARSSSSKASDRQKNHRCLTCGKAFLYPKDLRRHQIVHNPDQEKGYHCPYDECDYAVEGFHRKDTLKRHLKNVHGD